MPFIDKNTKPQKFILGSRYKYYNYKLINFLTTRFVLQQDQPAETPQEVNEAIRQTEANREEINQEVTDQSSLAILK